MAEMRGIPEFLSTEHATGTGFSLVPLGDNENPPRSNERLNDMPAAKLRASTILRAFHEAEAELVGKVVVLSDGKAGTVEIVSLDEDHGLRIAIGGHVGSWPISTIKFAQS